MLEYAVRSGASDIHIEPRENYIQLRYRIDGILKETNQLPKNIANALVSRVKILANLKIDESTFLIMLFTGKLADIIIGIQEKNIR